MRTQLLSDPAFLLAGTWLAAGVAVFGLTPLPLHNVAWGWTPAFWALAAPALMLLAKKFCGTPAMCHCAGKTAPYFHRRSPHAIRRDPVHAMTRRERNARRNSVLRTGAASNARAAHAHLHAPSSKKG